MMNTTQPQLNNLPESDIELLSGYIDNQLSIGERVQLERRLQAEPLLRAELDELQSTVTALKGLDTIRPPRSFTLDPAKLPKRQARFQWTWLPQFGSGLVGLLFVLMASVQMIGGGMAGSAAMPMAAEVLSTESSAMASPKEIQATEQAMAGNPAGQSSILEMRPVDETPELSADAIPENEAAQSDVAANSEASTAADTVITESIELSRTMETNVPAAASEIQLYQAPWWEQIPSGLLLGLGIVLLIASGAWIVIARRSL